MDLRSPHKKPLNYSKGNKMVLKRRWNFRGDDPNVKAWVLTDMLNIQEKGVGTKSVAIISYQHRDMIFSYAKNVIQVEMSKMGLPFFFKSKFAKNSEIWQHSIVMQIYFSFQLDKLWGISLVRLKYSLVQEKFPPFLSWPMFGVKGHVLNPTHNRLSMKAFLEKRRRFYQR